MLPWIIDFSLRFRLLVILAAIAIVGAGLYFLQFLEIDAFPDTTPVMVQINTSAPALAAEEVERQITFPVEQAISGLPRLKKVRSISKFGLSQVVVTFEDGADIYFARQLVSERLGAVELPQGIQRPQLGPVATGLGEVFHYLLTYEGYDFSALDEAERTSMLTELRTIQDWIVKPQLRSVPGVAEVNSWGGYEKQFQIRLDPQRLIAHGLTLEQVLEAIPRSNLNVGGGDLADGTRMLLIHGEGRTVDLTQIENIVLATRGGAPVRVRDVAEVQVGHEIRQGAVTAEGRGEAVLGLGFMLMGENSHNVTWALKNKLEEIKATLPRGVKIETLYDRTELVDHVMDTVRANLFEGGLLVIAVLFIFLGNLRAGLIVALAIPLSMLFAFTGMYRFAIAASLLSLGAIDFGMIVDSSVVMVENCVRRIGESRESRVEGQRRAERESVVSSPRLSSGSRLSTLDSRPAVIRDAAVEVRQPTLLGELIIMIVYLPILTLEGIEGKLFRPMALTVIFALLGSMVLSMTLMPALASLVLPRHMPRREPPLMRLAHAIHNPLLRLCMSYKWTVLGITLCVLLVAVMLARSLGAEFVPRLSEGAIAINVVRLAGTDVKESIRDNTQMEKAILAAFPDEVDRVWSRIGTGEVATDPMGTELSDLFITLRLRHQWKRASTQAELTDLLVQELRVFKGHRLSFSQPIEMRINEMISGVRSDVASVLYGDDFDLLSKKALEIQRILQSIPGGADVTVEQITGQPKLNIQVDQEQIARYGVTARQVFDVVESLGTKRVGEVFEEQVRFPLVVRIAEPFRANPEAIGAILVTAPSGQQVPLSRLAKIEEVEAPSTIKREWYQRRVTISANVRGRDLVGFVNEAKARVGEAVQLPAGRYRVEWGGQFEHYESARRRLYFVVPLAVGLIFALLYLTYHNVIDALRVMTGVPLGWVGGIAALWLRDMPFSISAAIGFIAMSGVAVLDDMILVSYIRQLRQRGLPRDEAVRQAAVTRLRPVLMTTLVAALGFLPMAVSTGVGAEVQRPLATVVIGGVISAMVMSLLVIRVLYVMFDGLARFGRRVLRRLFGWQDEQMNWLLGEDFDAPRGMRTFG
jgi:cobalt-zinc-cadmium resistance protein CzcA